MDMCNAYAILEYSNQMYVISLHTIVKNEKKNMKALLEHLF